MNTRASGQTDYEDDDEEGIDLSEVWTGLLARWRLIVGGALLAGLAGLGVAFLIPPTFTARVVFMPPQQQQSAAASALSSLGALAGLAGGGGIKTPADQYVALVQSTTVADRMVDRFKLLEVYEAKFRVDARRSLAANTRVTVGKKDGLIAVEVDDHDPRRAADMANAYVDGLRAMTNTLAISEAQQRRVFFEQRLAETKERLAQAQVALQATGFSASAIKAEPKAAAEGYARLRAELTTAEVKLQGMRHLLADNAPELIQQHATVSALRGELNRMEQRDDPATAGKAGADYVSKYREFKYQETLFDLFARQYEAARVDESREGALIQVVDPAMPPERKSKPKRALIALGSALAAALLLCVFAVVRRQRPPVAA